jgi:Peroxisome biogenesis factor 1, N-terminal
MSYLKDALCLSVPTTDGDVLELASAMIPAGFSEVCEVRVRALTEIRDADILTVEPLTPDDWELLEIRAEFLESAAFLRQVSLVYAGQIVQLWLGGKDVARVRVLVDNFAKNSTKSSNNTAQSPCLRLVQDTRISLVPKPRPKVDPVTPILRIYPTAQDYSQPMNELANSLGKPQIFTTPGTAFVNPATKGDIFGPFEGSEDAPALALLWDATFGHNEPPNENSCLLRIAFSSDIPKHHIGKS